MSGCPGLGAEGMGSSCSEGRGCLFRVVQMFWNRTVAMVAQRCEPTISHRNVHFKMVNFRLSKFYHNNMQKKKKRLPYLPPKSTLNIVQSVSQSQHRGLEKIITYKAGEQLGQCHREGKQRQGRVRRERQRTISAPNLS